MKLLILALSVWGASSTLETCGFTETGDDGEVLLQTADVLVRADALWKAALETDQELHLSRSPTGGAGETCTNLLNKNSHFAVIVAVGTPPQAFELVADTGSDAVIVTSCVCVDASFCAPEDHCFRGEGKSSTFAITTQGASGSPLGLDMTFGSGTVKTAIASDVVQVGGLKAMMNDGLLLMIDRRGLKVSGKFEGILGLGPPKVVTELPTATSGRTMVHKGLYQTKTFLKEAGVSRFSICFNDAAKPGVLRLNVPQFQKLLPAIGTAHWGLGLYGISVASETAPAIVCNPSDLPEGQATPCGAIPDSGTTLMMGPKDQVAKLFGSLCESWDRCQSAQTGRLKNMSAADAFQTLVYGCSEWITDEKGINEIPSIFLTVGSASKTEKIEMTAWAYITETQEEEYESQIRYLDGIIPVAIKQPTGKFSKVCFPSIGAEEYITQTNGPVWILGTPLFYQYSVGYDMQGPGIAFKKGPCTDCKGGAALLFGSNQSGQEDIKYPRPLRASTGPPRVRRFDKSLPL